MSGSDGKKLAKTGRFVLVQPSSNDVLWQFFMRNTRLLAGKLDVSSKNGGNDEASEPLLLALPTTKQSDDNIHKFSALPDQRNQDKPSVTKHEPKTAPTAGTQRSRTNFTPDQITVLEHYFHSVCKYPDLWMRQNISRELGIAEYRVQVWFQNRRSRFRREQHSRSTRTINNNINDNSEPDEVVALVQTTHATRV